MRKTPPVVEDSLQARPYAQKDFSNIKFTQNIFFLVLSANFIIVHLVSFMTDLHKGNKNAVRARRLPNRHIRDNHST